MVDPSGLETRSTPTRKPGPSLERGVLLFLHIPKTAGTTLQMILARQFARDRTYTILGNPGDSVRAFIGWPAEERERIQLVKGHMQFGLHHHTGSPATYITMLRDPVDRVISEYFFLLRSTDVPGREEVVARGMTLNDYVRHRDSIQIGNTQTRMLSGVEKVNARLWRGGIGPNQPPGDIDILALAKKNLRERFTLAGLSERFDESLLLLRRLLGFRRHLCYVNYNVTAGRPAKDELPREMIQLIEQHEELDMALYEYAERRFEEQLLGYPDLRADMRRLRVQNRLYRIATGIKSGFRRRGKRPTR
jgi:galactose-3-O-sulfotransferase